MDFTAADLVGRTSRSGAFKTMFLALRADGAADWSTKLPISPKLAGQADKIEFHHVFPKAYMRGARPDVDGRDVDDIANLAFISSKTNKDISAKAPADYASNYPAALLAKQLVFFEGGNDRAEMFEEFVNARREAIAMKLNEFLGVAEAP